MKIAVSSTGADIDAPVDPRFGRCQYFVVVDPDSMAYEAFENPNTMASGGAGIQSAQLVAERGAQVVLTGNCGPNAYQTLEAAGASVVVGVTGTVRGAVEAYRSGEFSPAPGPSVTEHYGSGAGPGQGPGAATGDMVPGSGRGMGPGMGGGPMGGRGGGRGCRGGFGMGGSGFGMGRGMGGPDPVAPEGAPVDEKEVLRTQARMLREQLDQIRRRISELEKEEDR